MGHRLNLFSAALLATTALVPAAFAQQAAAPATPDDTVVVTAVPVDENILPTTLNSSSTYGIDLNVMETPRNTTILSHAQLDTVNIQDTRSFSYLTSSSYTDSAFGGPNVPRIRGQYGDVFFNGMRSSFTSNGYGAFLSFNSIETINITKGPASVIAGPGPGVGGSVDLITKLPNAEEFTGTASVDFSSTDQRRWNVDFGGPIKDLPLSYRLSYSGEQSDSYFIGHFFDEHSLYGVLLAQPSPSYTVQLNSEAVIQNYEENVGVNRVNQQLIDNGTYLTGAPPQATITGFGTESILGHPVKLNPRITIDEAPGTSGHSFLYNAQAIQTLTLSDSSTLTNNTFFNYENRDNQAMYYYADSAQDTFSLDNRTDYSLKFDTAIGSDGTSWASQINAGFDGRFAHVNYVSNFNNEAVSVYDLSGNPQDWIFPPQNQAEGGAFPYVSADGRIQYGVPGRDSVNGGDSSISDTYDFALYLEHRIKFTPELSLLYGGRYDLVHADEEDPLGPPVYEGLWKYHNTAWYGLANGNVSPVYQFAPWGSFYITYDYTQNISGSSGDGGLGTYGGGDKQALQQTSRLYETGLKFNLLDNKLFLGSALFEQERAVPSGPNGTGSVRAKITGLETELNYQPERHFFATASYSYLRTRLDDASGFWNFPAQSGLNVDGGGTGAIFADGQHFNDPGVPQHVMNFLGNYRFDSGFGLRLGVQVTGPIDTTTSGYLDTGAMVAEYAGYGYTNPRTGKIVSTPSDLVLLGLLPQAVVNDHGYYRSPQIPWQYTLNAAVYYETGPYTATLSLYNLTNQNNWESSDPYYGNDFLVRADPLSVNLSLKMKF
jgi:outer membrane receptor protein involved in Fe transport